MPDEDQPITFDEVKRYRVEPGDVLIYRASVVLSQDACARIMDGHRRTFGDGVRALVLDPSMDLEVANAETA